MPAAHEDRLVLPLDPSPLLLPPLEAALEVIPVPNRYPALPVGSLFYERALVLDLCLLYYPPAFAKALLKLAFVCDSTPPFVDPRPCWLPIMKSPLEIIPIWEVFLSLSVLEEILKVAFIFLPFFCQMATVAVDFALHPLPHVYIAILGFPHSGSMFLILYPLSRVVLAIIPIKLSNL